MVRRLFWRKHHGPANIGALFLLVLLAMMVWQGCGKDPVTSRKSVIGTWELLTMKIDGEEVDYGYEELMIFEADHTGHAELYENGVLMDILEFDSWEVNGDSITVDIDGDISSAWYSCTTDRLTLKSRNNIDEELFESIYARVQED